ncbi:inactive serine/threonine-protein kinase VRK3 isoform X1 [Pantherophis guttatus]|uniref:Inactive serine/threonine-protein kinase VRK3 isoform X1 n=1 Tax=Pantherophis guttatus TaxID=94885 RepID=A0A6P9CSZ0_PANGU|nr:inactive serine/threonine-protein kinase VRK3 isoform X1 [Pantherophis guttatus]
MKSGGAARKRRSRAEEGDAAVKRISGPGVGMVNFCPQCGQKVEEMFHFCPACGGRLPVQEDEPMQITPSPSLKELNQDIQVELPPLPDKKKVQIVFPKKEMSSTSVKASPQSSTAYFSPKAKGKTAFRSPKKERCPCVKPLPDGEILTDLNNKQWMLMKLLSQSDRGLIYEARLTSERSPKHKYTLKLAAKEGKLFNEQNFLQRAAKKVTVEKWKKQYLMPFLGIPECVGFGVHGNSYRFLVFPELGRSLQSILDDNKNKMTEKAVLQLAVRLLDVLEYLHENEYTHGDLAAENIYVNPADLTVVTLADFSFAFRYSPGGKHVPQRECSRTPHEGTLEFISLDSHKGAAPSRRSDLESLGYCLVKWLCGALPWSAELMDPCDVTEEKERCKADIIKSSRLTTGWGALPESIKKYLQQVMTLEYEEKPNYEELRMFFTSPLQLMRASAYDSVDLRAAP